MIRHKGQLYWNDEETLLTEKMLDEMLDEKTNAIRYSRALDYYSIIPSVIDRGTLNDYQWLKMEYTVPYFADFIFRYRTSVFAVIFTLLRSDGTLDIKKEWDERFEILKKNDIVPCLLPFDKDGNIVRIVDDPFDLVDAVRYREEGIVSAVIPSEYADGKFRECSQWEKHNAAVMAIVQNLHDRENIDDLLYQSYIGVSPSVCWLDSNGVFNWMMIEEVGEKEAKPDFPEEILDRITLNRGKGHYGLCEFSSPYSPGVFPRGEKFDLKFEITDLY